MTPVSYERQEEAFQAVEAAFQQLQEIAEKNRIAYNEHGYTSHYSKLQRE